MKNKIILLILIFQIAAFAQSDRKFFTMFKGDSLAFFFMQPLGSNEALQVFRQTDTGYVNLTKDNPVTPVLDENAVPVLLGESMEFVQKALGTEDNFAILRILRSNTFRGTALCLFVPAAAKISGRWFVDKGVKEGKKYTYKLLFTDNLGDTLDIVEKTIVPKRIIPKAPSNLKLTPGDKQITLNWKYPKWNGSFDDLGIQFNVYRKTGKKGKFEKVNKHIIMRNDNAEPVYKDLWLKEGVTYTYYVTIVDPVGNESPPSNKASLKLKDVTPPEIIDLITDESDSLGIHLTWTMSPDLDAKGYYVYRSTGLSKKFKKLTRKLIPVDKPYFVDTAVVANKQFFYSVTVVDTAGNESEKSNPHGATFKDNVPPLPPTNFTYKYVNGKIKLSWKKSKSNDVQGYFIYRGRKKDITPKITDIPFKGTKYWDKGFRGKGFPNGGKIYYKIAALDSARNLSKTVELIAYAPDNDKPEPPSNFSLKNHDGRYVEIFCGISPSLDVAEYKIFRKRPNTLKVKTLGVFKKAPVYYRDTSVVKGVKYVYYAVAIDTAGNVSENSKPATITFKDYSPPPAPRDVSAIFKNGKVIITWGKVYDFDMSGYNVYRSNFPTGTFRKLNKILIKETKFIDRQGRKSYFYRVTAVDTSGNESKYDKTISPK